MSLPSQSAVLLQKVAVLDVVIGLGLLAYGLLSDNKTLAIVGGGFAVAAVALFLAARTQRPDPDGPVAS